MAIPVHDLGLGRFFYGEILCLKEVLWEDYSLNGHLVCHFVGNQYRGVDYVNPVDGDDVPVPHFGLSLETKVEFDAIVSRLREFKIQFIVEPRLRFKGRPGEQWTCFFKDPSNNNLEFKVMSNHSWLFKQYNNKQAGF